MKKITKFYVKKATYFGIDESGKKITLDINYWENSFKLDKPSLVMSKSAKKFLKNKHRVNFSHKLVQ